MKSIFPILAAISVCALLYTGCTKPPDYPDEPRIEFVSWGLPIIPQNSDSLWANLSFTDGDGNIGDIEDNNAPFLFVTDLRNNDAVPAPTLPLVPQQGAGNGISGDISFKLNGICCLIIDPLNPRACESAVGFIDRDTVVFDIYIEDQAGNKSNVVQSTPLVLICQ